MKLARPVVGALICILLAIQAGALRGDPNKNSAPTRIAFLIEQLGDRKYVKREAASKELERIGEPALGPLRQAATTSRDLEIRRRAELLVRVIAKSNLRVTAFKLKRRDVTGVAKTVAEFFPGCDQVKIVVDVPSNTLFFRGIEEQIQVVDTYLQWHDVSPTRFGGIRIRQEP